MKKLTLSFMILLVLLAIPTCSAQGPYWPYVLNNNQITCAPVSNCVNELYLPVGWYGSIYMNASSTCYKLYPWAVGYQINVFVQVKELCARTNTLMEAYAYQTTKWNYAPGNPYAQNNVIYAAAIQGIGVIYAEPSGSLLGSEFEIQDCYTGATSQSGGSGGTC